jgi:hypothetical protein
MRRCRAEHWVNNKWEVFEGDFHCWAPGYIEFESGPGNFLEALVEDDTGKVWACKPEIQFLDKEKTND